MSHQTELTLIHTAYREWNTQGVTGFESFLHSDIVWIDPPELPGGGTHTGRQATMDFLQEWEGSMGVLRLAFKIEEVTPVPDGYLVTSLAEGAGAGGAPIPPHHWFHWLTFTDGKISFARLFLDGVQAREAVGLPV